MRRNWAMLSIVFVALSAGQARGDVWSGVLNYWPFDEGKGLIAHDTTGRNNGLLVGFDAASTNTDSGWQKGRIGPYCLGFDGKNDYVDLGSKFSLPDNASISAWVSVQGFATGDRFYILTDTTPSPLMNPVAGLYDLGTSTYVQKDGSVWITDVDLGHVDTLHTAAGLVKPDGQWHQIAFLRGNWSQAIYVDGVKRAQGPLSINTYIDPPGTGAIGMGTYRVSPMGPSMISYADGQIDDVRVYNRLLTDTPPTAASPMVGASAGGEIRDVFLSSVVTGDANLDGTVSFADYIALANNFGQAGAWTEGDFNGDGAVSFADYIDLANNFGQTLIPEPATLAMLAAGALFLRRRHR